MSDVSQDSLSLFVGARLAVRVVVAGLPQCFVGLDDRLEDFIEPGWFKTFALPHCVSPFFISRTSCFLSGTPGRKFASLGFTAAVVFCFVRLRLTRCFSASFSGCQSWRRIR